MSFEILGPVPNPEEMCDSEIHLYLEQVLQEIKQEAHQNQSEGLKRCEIVNFVSRSAGRGKKRRPREINFLIVDKNHVYQIKNGEIKPRKNKNYIAPDVLINEILDYLPLEERTSDKLLELLEK